MKTTILLGLGAVVALPMAALTLESGPDTAGSSFHATIRGELVTTVEGEARFGTARGNAAMPAVFTLALGTHSEQGSILFTRSNGGSLEVGTYAISDRGDGTDALRALVATGSPTHPTGVFRGQAGTVVVTAASDSVLTGTFTITASGFLAAAPEIEGRPITASGAFRAVAD
jgi:hypothetical protein